MASATAFARAHAQSVTTRSQAPEPRARGEAESQALPRRIIRCDQCGSSGAAMCSVELRFFCVNHFVAYCYARLAGYESAPARGASSDGEIAEPMRTFLREAASQATKLLLIGGELQNMERARLFDIVLWSNELFYRSMSKFQYGGDGVVFRNR